MYSEIIKGKAFYVGKLSEYNISNEEYPVKIPASIIFSGVEPYRIKRAVFIAAGFGSRLVPITFNSPKPFVCVHGVRIIDHLVDATLLLESTKFI